MAWRRVPGFYRFPRSVVRRLDSAGIGEVAGAVG